MAVVPVNGVDKVTFYESRVAPWAANAVAMGSTPAAVADVAAKAAAARAAYNAQQAAQQVARAATLAYHEALDALAAAGAGVILQVRAKASLAGDGVYALAQIPSPSGPSPIAAPGTPTGFKAALNVDGSLTLTWRCANPKGSVGTMYQVWRRVGADGAFAFAGSSGKRRFVDAEVPAGASQVTYQIQAVRSKAAGPWAQFNVNFGSSGGGAAVGFVDASAAVRVAA